jgi:hypothetical protein
MFLIRRRLRLVLVLSAELGRCCGGVCLDIELDLDLN